MCKAGDSVDWDLFKIPHQSPDLETIENIFYLIGKQLNNNKKIK